MNSKTPQKKLNPYSNEAPKRGTGKKRPPKKITEDYLEKAGRHYLKRFAANTAQFQRVMVNKIKKSCFFHKDQDYETCTEILERVIGRFTEIGLLDDRAYAQASVNSMRRAGRSRKAIMMKLKSKGLSGTLIDEALETHDTGDYETPQDAEFEAALRFAKRKRIGPFAHLKRSTAPPKPQEKHFEKALSAFGRAGFSFDTARSVMDLETDEALARIQS